MSIIFLGGGNMASALIGGLVAHGQPVSQMGVVEIRPETAAALQQKWGIPLYPDPASALKDAGTLVLAVKPQQLPALACTLPALPADLRVISIAAGIGTAALSGWLKGHRNLVRAMPNMPALIGQGCAGLFALPEVSSEDRLHAQSLLRAVGSAVWVQHEQDLDAVTAVAGSGPAYLFALLEAMQRAAGELGLEAGIARTLVLDTVKGAAALAKAGELAPAELRRQVTSPGGTTEAAWAQLEQADWQGVLVRAIQAAAHRSQEIGRDLSGWYGESGS